jgi:hypothetical protein
MIISLKHRFIFIKGIKVAGTSIESYLSQILEDDAVISPLPYGHFPEHKSRNFLPNSGEILFNDHMPASSIRSIIGTWLYDRLYKFGVIRNPFDKLFSLYAMRKIEQPNFTIQMAICEIESEKSFLCDGDSLIVHRVILYEDLYAELKEVFHQLNIPFAGTLSSKDRSESREIFKNETVNLMVEDINEMTEKFAFEINIYKKSKYPVIVPLPGSYTLGANRYFGTVLASQENFAR